MHALLERCLWVRDRDLKRWGKVTAVVFALVGLFCAGSSLLIHQKLRQLSTSLRRLHEQDLSLIATLPDTKSKPVVTTALMDHKGIELKMIAGLRVFGVTVIGGSGLLFLIAGTYAWRASELATKLNDCPDSKPRS